MHPFLRSKITTVALTALTAWLLLLAVASGIRRHAADVEMAAVNGRVEDAQRENARLSAELARMQQPQWLALLARQRLNYKLPGETVIFVYKSGKADTIAQPQALHAPPRPAWRQWLDWFRGMPRE